VNWTIFQESEVCGSAVLFTCHCDALRKMKAHLSPPQRWDSQYWICKDLML
jgi:hypothetical protein